MILFIQAPSGGAIRMAHVTSADKYMTAMNRSRGPDRPEWLVIGKVQSRAGRLTRLRQLFAGAHITDDWYQPTPELVALIANDGLMIQRGMARSKRLSNEEVLQIFNLAHTSHLTDAEIGAKYGVSAHAVGHVARGQVYRFLFRRENTQVFGEYWISTIHDGAPRYLLRAGRRAR